MTYCLTRLSSPPEKATVLLDPKAVHSTGASCRKLQISFWIVYKPVHKPTWRELLLIDSNRVIGSTEVSVYAREIVGKHTESHEDTSNLLESGEKHSDEIPSEGGWSDRSITSAC